MSNVDGHGLLLPDKDLACGADDIQCVLSLAGIGQLDGDVFRAAVSAKRKPFPSLRSVHGVLRSLAPGNNNLNGVGQLKRSESHRAGCYLVFQPWKRAARKRDPAQPALTVDVDVNCMMPGYG